MTGLFAAVLMLASSLGDDAIVVVDDARGCVDEDALRKELPPLPNGSVLSVVVVMGETGGAARVQLEAPDDPSPLSRFVVIDPGGCASAAAIVARVVARHLEALPVSTWAAPAVDDLNDVEEVVVVVEASEADVAHVEVGAVGSVVAGLDGFQRVSVRPVVRGLAPVVTLGEQVLWLGGDVFARVGGLLPVAVGAGRVVGGDIVGGVAARAQWSRWSTSLGLEGGVLGVAGVGFSKDALVAGPTVNVAASLGMSFAPLWIDVVMQVPVVRARFAGDSVVAEETPLYLGVAVGGFVTIWP